MKFYVGLHHPAAARHFDYPAFISVNAVRGRKKTVPCKDWIMDSGAFTEIEKHGRYRHEPEVYAAEVNRLAAINPGLKAVVSQDYMCEAFMLQKTGLTIADHQRLTIERYDVLKALVTPYLIPVLQGYTPADYVSHLLQYGYRLSFGMYVGVGSVCKRNSDVRQVEEILRAIKTARPDLRLHGFGLKTTALSSKIVREYLESSDSMAWSFAARKQGRDANDPMEAKRFCEKIEELMNEPSAAPFAFTDAQPAGPNAGGQQREKPSKPTKSTAQNLTPKPSPAQPSSSNRRGRPKQETVPLKVELMHAIRAAAILDETDANAFEAVVQILNRQSTASRNRIARALVTVFAAERQHG